MSGISGEIAINRPVEVGADDGIVSTASLVIGVAAAAASRNTVALAGGGRGDPRWRPGKRSPSG